MKKRTGKTVCIGLAGLLLAQIISLQVLQAEPSAEDEQSGFSVLSQEVEPALTGPGPEAPGETAPAFEAAAVYSPTENAPAAETSIGQIPAAETAAEEGPAAETREADAPVESTPAEEPPTEEEPASKTPASEVADSNLQDMDAPSEEEYIPAYPEDRMAGEGLPVLRNITLGEDSSGAYISYYCETTDVLTLSLTDPNGYQVGNIVTQNPGSTFNTKKYILDIDNSALFNLSQSDLGKTIKFTVTGINSSGISGPVEAAGAVTLTLRPW